MSKTQQVEQNWEKSAHLALRSYTLGQSSVLVWAGEVLWFTYDGERLVFVTRDVETEAYGHLSDNEHVEELDREWSDPNSGSASETGVYAADTDVVDEVRVASKQSEVDSRG